MKQLPDAPWIRDAEISGYPVGEDADDVLDCGSCPMMPDWLGG